ncbi:TIM barrel protein [Ferrimonas lipolytica]|uniref:TIM barrel protein n=1 Tax=Ferrimonas lipolytica TaxID=2724191 RepID=A0A6H1UB31_9GAMM|nr:TIM barrel protein [Ferrimonas lipolytica]QIZ76275.1 TIM barrel protein [Ferrimonas lipolytica]
MKQLLNVCVSPQPGHLLEDWPAAKQWLATHGMDGYEIYPYGDVDVATIPTEQVGGLHLSFNTNLRPFWQQDNAQLLKLFDSQQNIITFFGCNSPDELVASYRKQFDLAEDCGAPYVVFHPVDCNLENLFDQQFPWHWRDTMVLMAELLNAALKGSRFSGKLLFENLWWPGSFRLDDRCEYDLLRHLVNYDNCGLCFDTGHMMATNSGLRTEQAGIDWLMERMVQLDLQREIETVHLNCSLNGAYIEQSKLTRQPYQHCNDFWQRLDVALKHVSQIDNHGPFAQANIAPLLELIAPNHLVHELRQDSLALWGEAIAVQRTALAQQLPLSGQDNQFVA